VDGTLECGNDDDDASSGGRLASVNGSSVSGYWTQQEPKDENGGPVQG
jgi:hypothetical protein